MDNSIVVEAFETLARALCAFPVVILGMWLSTKSWYFYSLVVAGFAWMAFVILGPVYDLWINPEVAMSVKVMAWFTLPIFFTVLNIGTVVFVKTAREEQGARNSG